MQEGRKGRVAARVVVVITIVAAVVAGVAFFGEATAQLAEITWSYSGQ
jgi:hypothetical protein